MELVQFGVRVRKDFKKELKMEAVKRGLSVQDVLDEIIFNHLLENRSEFLKIQVDKIRNMKFDPEGNEMEDLKYEFKIN